MKKLYIALLSICLGVTSSEIFASHMTGGAITYTAIPGAPNQYIITLKLYRDCEGITFENNPTISWESPSGCGPSGSTQLTQVPGTGTDLEVQTSNYPPCAVSTCNGGTAYGINEYVFVGMIDLGTACTDWIIWYTNCCRNAAITTGASNGNFYINTQIDNLNFHFDNSPIFNDIPVATFCVGRTYTLDMSATDPDGDSLVYILADSWADAGSPVPYNPPYSGSYPIASVPAPSIDPQTGILTLNPTMVQIGVLAVLVEAYDRTTGLLIGTIRRDLQVNVELTCNDPPRLDSIQVRLLSASIGCGDSLLHFKLTWPMRCSTLAADGSDFRLLSPSNLPILIKGAVGVNCMAGVGDSIKLFLRVPVCENGTYKLISKIGYDGNTLLNDCGIALPEFDTLNFQFVDCYPGIPDFQHVTVDEFDETRSNLIWSIPAQLDTNLFHSYQIYRSNTGPAGSYQWIGTTYSWRDTSFVDSTANPSNQSYSYGIKVQLTFCYGSLLSDSLPTIFLSCSLNADSISVDLNWNPYWGWSSPVYEILMTDGKGGSLAPLTNTSSTSYNMLKGDLGHYEARIKTTNGTFVAWSQTCSFDVLKNDPVVPNVITPNGDGLNDFFIIENMGVYPENKLSVFNRWGKKVFEKQGYNNEWDGGGLEDGTYYYVLKIEGRRPFDFHGTVNIYNHKQ